MTTDTPIYHMCRIQDWADAQALGCYNGSSQDRADGFIHFSTAAQLPESAARHRAGQTDLLLLTVDADLLGDALRWEAARDSLRSCGAAQTPRGLGGGALFPHLYGPLPLDAVLAVDPLPLGADGRHVFPDHLGRRP